MKYTKVCPICGKEFETNDNKQKYCSKECRHENNKVASREHYRIKNIKNKKCPICGIKFETVYSKKIFCSRDCYTKHNNAINKKKYKKIKCIICGNTFIPKSSLNKYCSKECRKERDSEYYKKARMANKFNNKKIKECKFCKKSFVQKGNESLCSDECRVKSKKEYKKRYRVENIEKEKEYYRKNIKKTKAAHKKYYEKNKSKIREYYREKYKQNMLNPEFKIKKLISNRIRIELKNKKNFKTFELLGYNAEDLRLHLELQFKKGMSWDNYGIHGWHIDHIKPVSAFKFIKEDGSKNLEEITECWSLNNLQPLWAEENQEKKNWYKFNDKMCRFSNGEVVEIREDSNYD